MKLIYDDKDTYLDISIMGTIYANVLLYTLPFILRHSPVFFKVYTWYMLHAPSLGN